MKFLYNKNFVNARVTFYIIIFLEYIYLAYFSRFQCTGCPLCGMTRAVKSLLILDFKSAFEFNNMVWIIGIILLVILIDIICILRINLKLEKWSKSMEKKSRKKSDLFNGFSLTKNIDKYGIINLIIWVSIPIILAIIIVSIQDKKITSTFNPNSDSSSYSSNSENLRNK